MAARRDEVLAFADELLDVRSYPDYGPVGLQVVGAGTVEKIVCGVSSSRELFERAGRAGAQLVLVHHGLFWDRDPRVVGPVLKGRLRALFDADLTLAAYHLALDAHPRLGNNALLADRLGIEAERRFAEIGLGGPLVRPTSIAGLADTVRERVGREPLVFPFGPERVARVAVCSGSAARHVLDAVAAGYDCLVTGEAEEPTRALAQESAVHVVAAGHYATETLGVQALAAELAREFGLEWEFVDLPNPV